MTPLVALLAVVLVPPKLPEKPPTALFAVPLTVKAGKTNKLLVRGLLLDGTTVSASLGTVKVLTPAKKANPTEKLTEEKAGNMEVEIELTPPAGAKPGPMTLTFKNALGASAPVTVFVGTSLAEVEPNDTLAAPQVIPLPCVVDGTIGKPQDCDVFRFAGKAGDKVMVRIEAAKFGSPVDAVLTVYDSRRRILATCDDFEGSADPRVTLTLPADGLYDISVIDANDAGGALYAYRLVVEK